MAAVRNRAWTFVVPLVGGIALTGVGLGDYMIVVLIAALIGSVLAAVHHAEVVALRVGEPFGSLILALAVTLIEVALIIFVMLGDGVSMPSLARDTIFATLMLILNGILGVCLLVGGMRHREQIFDTRGVSGTLAALTALSVLALVLPNFTTSVPGPFYAPSQLITVAAFSVALYGVFVLVQTVRHRDYFLPEGTAATDEEIHAAQPLAVTTIVSAVFLLASLVAVVLLAKSIGPWLERGVEALGAPRATVGLVIAAIVLLPEASAALRAARANRVQTSLNLALGSAMASIALTIPAVALLSLLAGWKLVLGLDAKSTVLLALTLLVATLTLSTGRTSVYQGAVHLLILAAYLATTAIP